MEEVDVSREDIPSGDNDELPDGIRYLEMGVVKQQKAVGAPWVVVVAKDFPWSPHVLSRHFNTRVFVSQCSLFSRVAKEYYERLGIVIISDWTFRDLKLGLEGSMGLVDEGWNWSRKELGGLLAFARTKPFLRFGGNLQLESRDPKGGLEVWLVEHATAGGVTSMISRLARWYSTSPGLHEADSVARKPAQDLRSVLKTSVPGRRAVRPVGVLETAVGRVRYLRAKEICVAGLFPMEDSPHPAVRTMFGSKDWITRTPTSEEYLAMKDIPEPLVQMISREVDSEALLRKLFESCRVPLKSLSTLLLPILMRELENRCPVVEEKVQRKKPGSEAYSNLVQFLPIEKHLVTPMDAEVLDEEGMVREELGCETSDELIYILEGRVRMEQSEARSKKSDDEAPCEMAWDIRALRNCMIRNPEDGTPLNWRRSFALMRRQLLRRWKGSVSRSAAKYQDSMDESEFSGRNREATLDCLRRVDESSFWGWDGGSRPFFWNWPTEFQKDVRDGFRLWLRPVDVSWKQPQPKPGLKYKALMEKKILDVRKKGYLARAPTKSWIRFFGVPKGDSDVRMVYDGTRSGLNNALWAPWFPLPTAATHLKMVDGSSWMADNDAGEFFLNWIIDPRIQELCGVDLTHFVSSKEKLELARGPEKYWVESWTRCAMGLRPSPYVCVKGMILAKEIIMGDQWDEKNVFRWSEVLLNLPGMKEFDSSKPWVSKRRRDGSLAADLVIFVDDLRPVAPSEEECWVASQLVSKTMAWLGLQDAARKRNPPSQSPGPWAGIVVTTNGSNVCVSVSLKKWKKTQELIGKIKSKISKGQIDHKVLESWTGYLVYVAQAYPSMKPYLCGLYGTLNSWRPNRTPDGFKIREQGKRQKTQGKEEGNDIAEREEEPEGFLLRYLARDMEEPIVVKENFIGPSEPPNFVRFVDRAASDVRALAELVKSDFPPLRVVRGCLSVSLIYGFGDASGSGFGSAIQLNDGSVFYRSGLWKRPNDRAVVEGAEDSPHYLITDEMSSNYRELRNLVDSVEAAAERRHLDGCQLLLFTDNTTAELAFHKGKSTSPELHELVLRLRKLEMTLCAELIVVHVSGKRMIESGIDGVSRGDMNAGMMAGQPVESFIPLHLSAEERSPKLLDWIRSWVGDEMEYLEANRWPTAHKGGGNYVWMPPPAAAEATVEWIGDSIQKRSNSVHVVIVPRIMTCRWRKSLGKIGDLELVIPCNTPVWPTDMFEPLVLIISLPLSRTCNEIGSWRFKHSKRIESVESVVSRVWHSDFGAVGDSLRKLLSDARAVRAV